eukprot:TRINITY_DN37094_c0_g1_i4.p1 TRINITY_DN37094_c0_g1~~TRINITY_DN37094_c0_g1_i4.p1  ORF type:complete len:479 (-),score=129.65 TRINITY_DN37094_c0_g1_i4:165-1601(-)
MGKGSEKGVKYFVNDLPEGVTEQDIQKSFERLGRIVDIRLTITKETPPRRIGSVTFTEASDEMLAGEHHVLGSKCYIKVHKESLGPACKVHVTDCASCSGEELREAFSKFGIVVDVNAPKDLVTGERKQFAFITFGKKQAVEDACAAGTLEVGTTRVSVKRAVDEVNGGRGAMNRGKGDGKGDAWGWDGWGPGPSWDSWGGYDSTYDSWGPYGDKGGGKKGGGSGAMGSRVPPGRAAFWRDERGVRYFLADVPSETLEAELKDHFSQYGKVLDAMVVKSRSKLDAYVHMEDDARIAEITHDEHTIRGRTMTCLLSKESLEGLQGKKVHVDNCESLNSQALREAFQKFGPVADVHTPKDPLSGHRKKFAFVTFATDQAVEAAKQTGSITINGTTVQIKEAAGPKLPDRGYGPATSSSAGADEGTRELRDGMKYYVPSLSADVTSEDLTRYFSKFGRSAASRRHDIADVNKDAVVAHRQL